MQIEHMAEFLAALDNGSISAAASRMYLAQPVMSKHIKSIENELGAKLLERSRQGISPTKAGGEAYKTFKGIVASYNELKEQIKRSEGGAGLLRMGMLNLGVARFVLPTVSKLQELYPDVEIRYSTKKPDELLDGVQNGKFDVAFLGAVAQRWTEILEFFPIAQQEVFFLVSKKHPHAMKDCVEADDLSGHPLLCLRDQPSTEFMNKLVLESGIKPSAIVGVDELELVPALAARDNAFFAVPSFMLEKFGTFTETSIVRYVPTLRTQLSFIYTRDNANPILARFLEAARQLKASLYYRDA